MSDIEVTYSAKHPKGTVVCELCLKTIPWPSYNSHTSDCWNTPPRSGSSVLGSEPEGT